MSAQIALKRDKRKVGISRKKIDDVEESIVLIKIRNDPEKSIIL
jgi:hypothetical protein